MNTPDPAAASSSPAGILVTTDFSTLAQVAVDAVISLVKDQPNAQVTLLHVVETWHVPLSPDFECPMIGSLASRRSHAEQQMDLLRLRYEPQIRLHTRVLSGNPARVICDVAHEENFRVIVLSSHGHAGIARMFLGSVAESVVQNALCPVLVVKPHRNADGGFDPAPVELKLERLLVGYDHRSGSERALTVACDIAKRANAKITLVHAIEPAAGPLTITTPAKHPAKVDDAFARLAKTVADHASSAREWSINVEEGYPWDVIIDLAKNCDPDLIIVGPHDHTRWGHCFIGSTAQRVVRLAPCSVLAVK